MICKKRFPVQILEHDKTWTLICPDCNFKVKYGKTLFSARKHFLKYHSATTTHLPLPRIENGKA